MNLERELFRKCFRNKTFPLQLSILFATLAANKSLFVRALRLQTLRKTVTVTGRNMGMPECYLVVIRYLIEAAFHRHIAYSDNCGSFAQTRLTRG